MDSSPPDPQPVGSTEGGAVRELSVIQKCYDLILWLQPRLQKLPRDARFTLGTRIETGLYELLDLLIEARYTPSSTPGLQRAGICLERLRYQLRLLRELGYLDARRTAHASELLMAVGKEVGGWLKHRKRKALEADRRIVSRDRELGESGRGSARRPAG